MNILFSILAHCFGWPAFIALIVWGSGKAVSISSYLMAVFVWSLMWGWVIGLGLLADWLEGRLNERS